jgi:AmmeMemoRadiSam system protein B
VAIKEAELIVIFGTDHNEEQGRITLTRQNYETPWGIIPTAQDMVDELENEIGKSAFECELNHRGEHSIESALVWLHYLLADKICPILPVLCGSFQSFIERGNSPVTAAHVASTVDILRRATQHRRTIIVASADLAHVGPVFGDSLPVDIVGQSRLARQDKDLISVICHGKADGFFAEIEKEKNRRQVCGTPPIFIALSVMSGAAGMPVGYAQCPAGNDGTSFVSICGVVFSSVTPS